MNPERLDYRVSLLALIAKLCELVHKSASFDLSTQAPLVLSVPWTVAPVGGLVSDRQPSGHSVLRLVPTADSDLCLIVINRLVFVMEMRCVFCEVLVDYLRVKLQRLEHSGIAASHPLVLLAFMPHSEAILHSAQLSIQNTVAPWVLTASDETQFYIF